jgi:hypothetical protein
VIIGYLTSELFSGGTFASSWQHKESGGVNYNKGTFIMVLKAPQSSHHEGKKSSQVIIFRQIGFSKLSPK